GAALPGAVFHRGRGAGDSSVFGGVFPGAEGIVQRRAKIGGAKDEGSGMGELRSVRDLRAGGIEPG
ncbi:MAG TPA: hypothetical protein VMN36_00100, partial [Verrucomicrobiales bacterium]|nr:hypothetical protein [Verrucomicrobiales bacterium]